MTPLHCLACVSDAPVPEWKIASEPRDVLGRPGHVWVSDTDGMVKGQWGIILGRIFAKADDRLLRVLPADAPTTADAVTLARWIVNNCWGGWIALLRDHGTHMTMVARDPGSYLPVYKRRFGRCTLLSTDVSRLWGGECARPSVSWHDLHLHLRYPELRQSRTCLAGIIEVAPGALSQLDDDGSLVPLWDPWGFASARSRSKPQPVAASVRARAIACVSAWASLGDRVAVSASGGLDSSIICACLAASGHPFDCVTVSTPDPSGDESDHVRVLADALGVRMVSHTFEPATWNVEVPASLGLPRPTRKAFMVELQRRLAEACGTLGADMVFDGNGGDNLFCYLHSASPIIDCLRDEGFGRSLGATFVDMCRITECDMLTMARALVRQCVSRAKPVCRPDHRLLSAAFDLPEPLTPWWGRGADKYPGKTAHIALIQRSQNFEHGLGGLAKPTRLSVLMSQPLIETCLAIPAWQWSRGGINRALARRAFRDDLPQAILARRSKAGPDSVLRSAFAGNRSVIREMLLGGLLVENGLLDVKATADALGADEHGDDQIINRLLDLVEAEAWARSWSGS